MNIKIIVATHKQYRMPEDDIYLPVHVGKKGKDVNLGYQGDDTGDNISVKNSNFCELTAIYWGWKNLDANYIGLSHYRRHFRYKKNGGKWESILTGEQARQVFEGSPVSMAYDIIVPDKRKYYIETNYSHYIHAHEKTGIDLLIEIIRSDYPEYEGACKIVMNRTWAHMFNMFIMKKDCFDAYCEWLFDILFKIEKQLDTSIYSAYEKRVFGFLSELMLDIWLISNNKSYYECPVMFMEKQNWIIKGGSFILRKIKGRR